jgi:hypothetical protein
MLNSPLWRRLLVFASALFLGVLVLAGFLMPRTAFTQATTPQRAAKAAAAQCSLATLHGTYVTAADGFGIVGSDRVPFALAAFETYDGKGHLQGVFSANSNGTVVAHQVRFTGTYTVKSDCTVTETDIPVTGSAEHFDEFTTPDGSLITSVQTDPGAVSASVLSRRTGQQAGN